MDTFSILSMSSSSQLTISQSKQHSNNPKYQDSCYGNRIAATSSHGATATRTSTGTSASDSTRTSKGTSRRRRNRRCQYSSPRRRRRRRISSRRSRCGSLALCSLRRASVDSSPLGNRLTPTSRRRASNGTGMTLILRVSMRIAVTSPHLGIEIETVADVAQTACLNGGGDGGETAAVVG